MAAGNMYQLAKTVYQFDQLGLCFSSWLNFPIPEQIAPYVFKFAANVFFFFLQLQLY